MNPFFVADLNTQGELRQVAQYDYATLELIPGAMDIISRCSKELWRSPEEMEAPLSDNRKALLRWRATASSAGIATVRRGNGELVSLSLLASGQDPEADRTTFEVLQKHLVREFRQTQFEPAFDLMELNQRPLVATINFVAGGDRSEQMIHALADRCFAASYFRYLGLA